VLKASLRLLLWKRCDVSAAIRNFETFQIAELISSATAATLPQDFSAESDLPLRHCKLKIATFYQRNAPLRL